MSEISVEAWKDYHGDLPDYDHPLRCVYKSGIQYAVELLAKELKVEDWEPCDGTEEFDGDLGGTLMNIVLAALPKDEHGDDMWPSDIAAALSQRDEIARERDELVTALAEADRKNDVQNYEWNAAEARCEKLAGAGRGVVACWGVGYRRDQLSEMIAAMSPLIEALRQDLADQPGGE